MGEQALVIPAQNFCSPPPLSGGGEPFLCAVLDFPVSLSRDPRAGGGGGVDVGPGRQRLTSGELAGGCGGSWEVRNVTSSEAAGPVSYQCGCVSTSIIRKCRLI